MSFALTCVIYKNPQYIVYMTLATQWKLSIRLSGLPEHSHRDLGQDAEWALKELGRPYASSVSVSF